MYIYICMYIYMHTCKSSYRWGRSQEGGARFAFMCVRSVHVRVYVCVCVCVFVHSHVARGLTQDLTLGQSLFTMRTK